MTNPISDYLQIRAAGANGFSADGSTVLVSSNLPGISQLFTVASDGGEPVQITNLDEPVSGSYMPVGDDILLAYSEGGNERTQIHLLRDGEIRPLVVDPAFIHNPGGITRDASLLAFTSNRRNGTDFDVYVMDMASGEQRCLFAPGGWCSAGGFSPDGKWLAVSKLTERNGDNELHLVSVADGSSFEVAQHDEEASISSAAWLADSSGFCFTTDIGSEFEQVARFDMKTRQWEAVLQRDWDSSISIDWNSKYLAVRLNADGFTQIELFDPASMKSLGEFPLPEKGITGPLRFSQDSTKACYTFVSASEPGDAWVYDFETRETTRLTNSPCDVPRETFVHPELHRYESFDGESIPAFVFRPKAGEPAGVVVTIHGGPESQYVPSFNPITQYLVAQGFAVVAPNVRGSTGYGKRFHHLDDVRKRLDSVKDLASLHSWLKAMPEVDANRVALMGGSYGGYMVLAGLAFQPELWAAGVDVVGISSLVTFLENTSAYRRRFREREYGSLERDREFLLEASPITKVDEIRAPLLIIHGANDPRVPLSEAEQIHKILSEKGVECELLVYHDEGHGLAKLKNRMDAYPKVADFLHRVL